MTAAKRGRPRERSSVEPAPKEFVRAVSYVDTVVVQMIRKVMPDDFRRALVRSTRPFGGRYVRKIIPTANGFFILKIWIHQPTAASLELLADFEATGWLKLLEVHVALDLIASSHEGAEILRHHIEGRLLPSVRAKYERQLRNTDKKVCAVSSVGDTTYYFKDIGAGTEIAIYSDRFSKTAYGAPCCHVEFRLRGAGKLRAADLSGLQSVISLNHRKFWDSQLSLWRHPTVEAIARASNGTARSRTPESLGSAQNKRDARRMIRLATHTDRGFLNGYLLYLELRNEARKYNERPLRLFQNVNHDWALPPPQNGLWPTNHPAS